MGNRCVVVRCALSSSHRKRVRDRGRGIVRCPGQRTCGAGGSGRRRMGSRDALVGAGVAVGRLGIRVAWPARASRPASRSGPGPGPVRAPLLGRPACGARFVPFSAHPSELVAGSIEERRRRTSLENWQQQQCHHATRTELLLDGGGVRWVATCKALLDFDGEVVFRPSPS
ncbi:hypothetical protein PVAP13_4KG395570 [Panicum virgatum]|uniref:Uncharacterized protein n=1 Tax=Panicum virgatum TaxID=38727 RepID=A0A8T0TP41_PANVG|nr:hypothetical protein PVAP13_4KG395570 [Panicum virgatum]